MKKLVKLISASLLSVSILCGALIGAKAVENKPQNVRAANGGTVTVEFGTNKVEIDKTSVDFTDSNGVNWNCTTAFTGGTSFTSNAGYFQIGSKNKPATSINITADITEPSFKITSFSSKWGGFSGTAGTISMKVNGTEVANGSLNASSDVDVTSGTITTESVSSISISVTSITRGVKLFNLSYSYEKVASTNPTITFDKTSIDNLLTTDSVQLIATAANFTPTSYTWESLDTSTATVEGTTDTATITGVKKGTTQITVKASDGTSDVTQSINVTVLTKPNRIAITSDGQEVSLIECQVGKSKKPTVSVFDATGNELTTAEEKGYGREIISGGDYVTLSGTTQINGVKAGTAVIRYTSSLVSTVFFDLTFEVKEDSLVSISSVALKDTTKEYQIGDTFSSADITVMGDYHFSGSKEVTEGFTFSLDSSATSSEFSEITFTEKGLITVYIFNSALPEWKGSISLDVTDAKITGIEVDGIEKNGDLKLNIGEPFKLNVKILPENVTLSKEYTVSVTCDIEGAIVYDNEASTLTAVKGVANRGDVAIVTITSVADTTKTFEFTVTVIITLKVNKPSSITKVTSTDEIVSGDKYYIVYENSETEAYIFTGVDAVNNYIVGTISNGTITSVNDQNFANGVTLTGDSISGYSIQINSGTNAGLYVSYSANNNGLAFGTTAVNYTVSFDSSKNVIITNPNGAVLRFNKTKDQMRFRFFKSTTYTGQQSITLYHIVESITEDIIISDTLINTINDVEQNSILCNSNGVDSIILWDEVKTKINSLSSEEKDYLIYGVADENGNIVENFLAKYDYIVSKYSEYDDFLNRNARSSTSGTINSLSAKKQNVNVSIVLAVVTMSTLTTFLGLYLLRKKKEQ